MSRWLARPGTWVVLYCANALLCWGLASVLPREVLTQYAATSHLAILAGFCWVSSASGRPSMGRASAVGAVLVGAELWLVFLRVFAHFAERHGIESPRAAFWYESFFVLVAGTLLGALLVAILYATTSFVHRESRHAT